MFNILRVVVYYLVQIRPSSTEGVCSDETFISQILLSLYVEQFSLIRKSLLKLGHPPITNYAQYYVLRENFDFELRTYFGELEFAGIFRMC